MVSYDSCFVSFPKMSIAIGELPLKYAVMLEKYEQSLTFFNSCHVSLVSKRNVPRKFNWNHFLGEVSLMYLCYFV